MTTTTTTTIIEGREFTVAADFTDGAEGTFETGLAMYREVRLTGVRGALYTSERWLGTDLFRFWSETPGKRSKLPTQAFRNAVWFTMTEGLVTEASYEEVKQGFTDAKEYKAL
jgi:hypothetical protein